MYLAADDCRCPIDQNGPSIINSPVCPGTFLFMIYLEAYIRGRCDISTPCQNPVSKEAPADEYDFIVVGAGAAGPIVARRLAEGSPFSVVLLEAGGDEPIGSRIPSFYRAFWSNEEVDWDYRTVPRQYCLDQGGKGCKWLRGKVLGGSTVLNGMMYHRGHAADYEDWVDAGAEGWSWEENLPFFDRTEGNKQIGTLVSANYHSDQGPLPVQQFNYQPQAVYSLLEAINETGFPVIADMNDPKTPAGFAIAQTFNKDGQRYSTARAFLKPKSELPNLDVQIHSQVTRVLFENKRAVGVEYINKEREKRVIRANKEVILCAGTINSPQILMLSGVGPKETLESLGIKVIADLPVGKNLLNHVGVTFNFLLDKVDNKQFLDWEVANEYLTNGKGPMSGTGITQLTGLLYSSLGDIRRQQPDLQFFFNGFYAECSMTGEVGEAGPCNEGLNISANAISLLPRSQGQVTLNSSDPLDYVVTDPNFFSHPDDMIMVKDAARLLQRIFESRTLKEKYGIRLDPSTTKECEDSGDEWSDPWLECMIRYSTDPQNHQLGTAAMGRVLDPRLRVLDLSGIRVIDASSMPTPPSGNPQGPVMMVAERGAHFILEEHGY